METQQDLLDEATLLNTPKIYSKLAIRGFSIFFTSIFGGILLMQNLRDIGKKKEANIILLLSVLFTAASIFIVNIPAKPSTSLTYICNIIGGYILSEYFYKKYFPNDNMYEKKKIWKPLIISILITIPFIIAMIYSAKN
jgi:thymidylate kinase